MIKKEDYLKAKETVEKYEEQLRIADVMRSANCYNEPILTWCKVLTTTRAKKALNKLINAGYNAKMMLLNNKIILIYKN